MRIKNLISFILIFGVFAIVSLTVSAQISTTERAKRNAYIQCDKNRLSPIKCGYRQEGFIDGTSDARNNRRNDYKRYRKKYSRQYESFYRSGYDEGYKSVKPYSAWTNQQRDAYEGGYDYGADDSNRRISRLPARYEGRYNRSYEAFYRKGYYDGYDKRPRQYDTQIGGNGNPRLPSPNRGGNRRRGTATGTLTWNGRVDNRVNIVLKGNDVQTKSVAGRLSGVYKNLQGTLPRRNATVSVRKLDGRGTARVIQQPNRANNYTAIVQVFDERRSDDNYNLQITWRASSVQETYTPGKLSWRGKVDGTVDIRISGDFVETLDTTSSGLTDVRYDLNGYLARRNGSVRVNKRDGRGSVSIVEQPSRQNDYTAVIRISDPKRGDDKYEIDVTW